MSITVYVAFDNSIATASVPTWLSSWQKTGETIAHQSATCDIYAKEYTQGLNMGPIEVELPGIRECSASTNYTVFVKANEFTVTSLSIAQYLPVSSTWHDFDSSSNESVFYDHFISYIASVFPTRFVKQNQPRCRYQWNSNADRSSSADITNHFTVKTIKGTWPY